MSGFPCPHCGVDLPRNARACRECGSDENTGWKPREEIDLQSVDLPADEDYEDFLEREGLVPKRRSGRSGRPKLWVVIAAVALLGALVFSLALL